MEIYTHQFKGEKSEREHRLVHLFEVSPQDIPDQKENSEPKTREKSDKARMPEEREDAEAQDALRKTLESPDGTEKTARKAVKKAEEESAREKTELEKTRLQAEQLAAQTMPNINVQEPAKLNAPKVGLEEEGGATASDAIEGAVEINPKLGKEPAANPATPETHRKEVVKEAAPTEKTVEENVERDEQKTTEKKQEGIAAPPEAPDARESAENAAEDEKVPTTKGELLEKKMRDAIKDFKKGDPTALIKGLCALLEYIGLAMPSGGSLDDSLEAKAPDGGNATKPEDAEKQAKQAKRNELREEIRKNQSGVDGVTLATEQARTNTRNQINAARQGRTQNQKEMADANAKVEQLTGQITNEQNLNEKATLEGQLGQAKAQVQAFQAKIDAAQTQIGSLEKLEQSQTAKLKQIEDMKTETTRTVETINGNMKNMVESLKIMANKGNSNAGTLAEMLKGCTFSIETTTLEMRMKNPLDANPASLSGQFKTLLKDITGKIPTNEEIGVSAEGKLIDQGKFIQTVQELMKKLEENSAIPPAAPAAVNGAPSAPTANPAPSLPLG